jgi:hypothetical protein
MSSRFLLVRYRRNCDRVAIEIIFGTAPVDGGRASIGSSPGLARHTSRPLLVSAAGSPEAVRRRRVSPFKPRYRIEDLLKFSLVHWSMHVSIKFLRAQPAFRQLANRLELRG